MAAATAMGKHGYDGREPEFAPARDIEATDRHTGRTIREKVDGPENVQHTRVRHMHFKGRLTDRQAEAASRYQNDWQASQIYAAQSAGMVKVSSGFTQSTLTDSKLNAQDRHRGAFNFLRKRWWARYAGIVELTVIEDNLLEVAASKLHMHHQKAAAYLECGLDLLADHYGL